MPRATRELRVQPDGEDQGAEDVRHAPGKAADGLHLPRVPQVLLESAALGDVAGRGVDEARPGLGYGSPLEDAVVPALAAVPGLEVGQPLALPPPIDRFEGGSAILGGKELDVGDRPPLVGAPSQTA